MSTPKPTAVAVTLTALFLLLLLQSSPSEAKCGHMVDERDVVVLGKNNYTDFLTKNRYVLVNFYAPWCYWSRRLAPDYASAATMLKGEAVLAKVNGPLEKEIKEKNRIHGYPTLIFYVNGVKADNYFQNRTREGLVSYVRSMVEMSKYTVRSRKEAKSIMDAKTTAVLGFLPSLKGKEAEIFSAVSKLHGNVKFYQFVSPYVAETFHIYPLIKRPALVMMKDGHQFILYVGAYETDDIGKFVALETTLALPAAAHDSVSITNGRMEEDEEEDDVISTQVGRSVYLLPQVNFRRSISVNSTSQALFSFPDAVMAVMARLTQAAERVKRNMKLDFM